MFKQLGKPFVFVAIALGTLTYFAAKSSVPEGGGKPIVVRVVVWDETENDPLHAKAELWFRGFGSWWLKEETKYGSADKTLGRRRVGIKFVGDDSIQLYPSGRDGQQINIPLMMTTEMNPEGSDRDTIHITISDDEIEIVGLPVKAAMGDSTMKSKRR